MSPHEAGVERLIAAAEGTTTSGHPDWMAVPAAPSPLDHRSVGSFLGNAHHGLTIEEGIGIYFSTTLPDSPLAAGRGHSTATVTRLRGR